MNIKDSGERTTFNTGAQRDMHGGKGRMDLLPWAAIIEVSKHCEAGALKYGTHNVDKGIPTSSLLDSAMRHAAKYLDGQEDEDHLLAAAWNLLWAIENTKRYHGAVYTKDVFSESPQEIPYLQAAKVLREVSDAPAADVAPVVHGVWVCVNKIDPISGYRCSKCRRRVGFDLTPYCPNCGAKMDGGDNDAAD